MRYQTAPRPDACAVVPRNRLCDPILGPSGRPGSNRRWELGRLQCYQLHHARTRPIIGSARRPTPLPTPPERTRAGERFGGGGSSRRPRRTSRSRRGCSANFDREVPSRSQTACRAGGRTQGPGHLAPRNRRTGACAETPPNSGHAPRPSSVCVSPRCRCTAVCWPGNALGGIRNDRAGSSCAAAHGPVGATRTPQEVWSPHSARIVSTLRSFWIERMFVDRTDGKSTTCNRGGS